MLPTSRCGRSPWGDAYLLSCCVAQRRTVLLIVLCLYIYFGSSLFFVYYLCLSSILSVFFFWLFDFHLFFNCIIYISSQTLSFISSFSLFLICPFFVLVSFQLSLPFCLVPISSLIAHSLQPSPLLNTPVFSTAATGVMQVAYNQERSTRCSIWHQSPPYHAQYLKLEAAENFISREGYDSDLDLKYR